jgi:hypothetical protein
MNFKFVFLILFNLIFINNFIYPSGLNDGNNILIFSQNNIMTTIKIKPENIKIIKVEYDELIIETKDMHISLLFSSYKKASNARDVLLKGLKLHDSSIDLAEK